MNIDALNKWLTLSANVGVLVGIGFLAIEISQNTQVNRSIALDSIANGTREQLMAPVHDNHLLEILLKSDSAEELTRLERVKVGLYTEAFLRHLENAFNQHQSNLLDSELFISLDTDIRAMTTRNEIQKRWWRINKNNFSSAFRLYVNSISTQEQVSDDAN